LVLVSQAAVLPVIASTSTGTSYPNLDYIYDVVVVGAGSAGIAASYTLTQHNV